MANIKDLKDTILNYFIRFYSKDMIIAPNSTFNHTFF